MRYWILPAVVCWALAVSMIGDVRDTGGAALLGTAPGEVLRDRPFQDQMAAAIELGVLAFVVFGIVQKAIRERGLRNWTSRVAFRAAQVEPPVVKLNDRLLVEERLQAFVGAASTASDGLATTEHSGHVQRLYEALDE